MQKRSVIAAAILSMSSALATAADMDAVFDSDVLCDPSSNSWMYIPPPAEATLNALTEADWLRSKPVNRSGMDIHTFKSGKTWQGFPLKSIAIPEQRENTQLFGSKVTVLGGARSVARQLDGAIRGGMSNQSFVPTVSVVSGSPTMKRVIRFRDGTVYTSMVVERQGPQGAESTAYCAVSQERGIGAKPR